MTIRKRTTMRYLWFGAFVLTTICIGVYYTHPSKEKGKAMGQIKKVRAYFCPTCEEFYGDDLGLCVLCDDELQVLEFVSVMQLTEHIKRVEEAQRNRGLSTRMPGCRFTSVEAELFEAFEKRNQCILSARPSAPVFITTQEQVQPSIQACIDVNRLKFGRYLVQTGRISEWED